MINHEALKQLIANPNNDSFSIELIDDCLKSFEKYHAAVYELEITRRFFADTMDAEEYRKTIQSLDRTRTVNHNSLISNVGMLNRMAANYGLPLVYDGVVSEERPYRRELADAVFEYVEQIIQTRM